MLFVVSILLCATNYVHGWYGGFGDGRYGGLYNYNRQIQMKHCECPDFEGLIVTPRKDTYDNGETIQLSCEEGYEFKGKREDSTCRVYEGFFSNRGVFMPLIHDRICEELPLCRPPKVEGLKVNSDKGLFEKGENITISCEEGYELVGEDTYTCEIKIGFYGEYGTFGKHVRKACQEIMSCNPPEQDGLIIEPMKESYAPGENISIACKDGYEISVYETTTCQPSGHFRLERIKKDDGKQKTRDDFYIYFNQVCIQKAECKAPKFDGVIVSPMKSIYESGDKITISCEEGYELKGTNSSVCANEHGGDIFSYIRRLHGYGRFSPKVTSYTCVEKEQCQAPKAQPGLILTPAKGRYDLGETVELSCEEGYELTDQTSAKCVKKNQFLRHWGQIWRKQVNRLSPWASSDLCTKTPTEQTKEEVETMNTTTITPTRVTFSIRPELLTPETITTEATESESSGQDDGSESDEDSNDLKKSDS